MKRFSDDSRANIEYPVRWKYTVIGVDRPALEAAIVDVVGDESHKTSLSNTSSKGKYVSISLELIVLNETERLRIFDALRSQPAVSFVL